MGLLLCKMVWSVDNIDSFSVIVCILLPILYLPPTICM